MCLAHPFQARRGGGPGVGERGGVWKSINTTITKYLSICTPPPPHRGKEFAPSTTIYLVTAVPRLGLAPLSKAGHRIHYHFYWTSLLDVCSLILQPRHGFAQHRASISPLRYKEISNTVIESGWCVDQHSSAGPRSIPHSTAAQIYFKKRTRQICHW